MKTRTLLTLALACGLAIMLAGAVFLFQLTTQDELAEPVPIGEQVRVGDMMVSVTAASEQGDGRLAITIEIGGTVDEQPADEFRLIASGRALSVLDTTCPPAESDVQACIVSFDVSEADGVSRVLFYERGEDRARWVLG